VILIALRINANARSEIKEETVLSNPKTRLDSLSDRFEKDGVEGTDR